MANTKLRKKKKTGSAYRPSSNFHMGFITSCNLNNEYLPGHKSIKGSKKEFDPNKYPANDPVETKKK